MERSTELLASSSRDRTVRVWDSATGRQTKLLNIPKGGGGGGGGGGDQKQRLWVSLSWVPGGGSQLVVSSYGGQLLTWDISQPKPQAKKFAAGHTRSVFTISFDPGAVVGKGGIGRFMTVSLDRDIIEWDINTLKVASKLPSLGGFVYALDTSPLDPNRMAVAVGNAP